MEILSLELQNFRIYERVSLDFSNKLNFFIGSNASGKTTILEALAYISLGRSFRGGSDSDLVKQGQNHFFIRCELKDRTGQQVKFEIGVETGANTRKKVKRNGVILKRMSEMIGSLVCVVFTPEDLSLVQGGHSERRSYIDFVLGSVDSEYLEALVQFNRALRQRNELLRRIQENKARVQDLYVWNDLFIQQSAIVQRKRRDFLVEFEPVVVQSVETISGLHDKITLKLESSFDDDGEIGLKQKIDNLRNEEIRAGHSLVGPHRDRLYFLEESGQEIGHRFSQGQKRTLALSLKVAQFYYLKQRIGCPPVLLVDDVLQELDMIRRNSFLEVLNDCGQAFFTTPELNQELSSLEFSNVYSVEDAQVSERK
ncbi:MAG: DNA replication and repair protein RecF [Leptonema sp. (in: Bacteria)]|nr:DNA replication and repair protein RecF [Leptonema sp. (in: bacteria)]